MSSSLSSTWIKSSVLNLLSDEPKNNFRTQVLTRKTVQVTRIFSELNVIEISDKSFHIALALNSATMKHLEDQDAFSSLDGLRNSVVKIQNWHISTVAQCIDAKNIKKAVQLGITMPFALQCDKMELLGAEDCIIFGEPTDINQNSEIRRSLSKFNYASMMQRFVTVQFPDEYSLPNADGQFCVTRLAQTRVEVDPADDANSAPTPVARRTRTAPVKAAKRIIPAPANRRVKARATDSSAPEEEDPFLLCLEDCIIPADQSQKLLRDSVIFRQRSGASSSQTADAVPSATPVARRTRNKQQSQPAATQVDDTLEGTLVETQASSQVPFLATQVCDDVSGLEYVITQQEDACAVITVPAQSSSQLSGLSSQEVLFGPSHWFDPAVSGSSSSGAGAGASQTMAATIASIEAQVNPASSTSTSATTTTTAAASQSQELDKTVVRRIVPHRSPSRDQIKSPVTKAGSSAAAAAKSPVTKAGSSAAAAAKSPATKPGSSAVAAAAAKSPATKAGSSAAAAAKSPVTKAGSSVAAAAAAKSPATKAGSSAAAAAKSPVTKAGSSAAAAAAKSPVPKAGSSAVSTAAAIVPKSEPAQTVQDDESIDFDDLTQKQYPQQPRGGPPARAMAPSSAKVIEIPAEPLRRKREEPPAGPSKRPAKTKVGRRVSKFFGPQYGHYKGIVTALNSATGYYMIEYEDGDAEEMTELELCKFLIPAMMC